MNKGNAHIEFYDICYFCVTYKDCPKYSQEHVKFDNLDLYLFTYSSKAPSSFSRKVL